MKTDPTTTTVINGRRYVWLNGKNEPCTQGSSTGAVLHPDDRPVHNGGAPACKHVLVMGGGRRVYCDKCGYRP